MAKMYDKVKKAVAKFREEYDISGVLVLAC